MTDAKRWKKVIVFEAVDFNEWEIDDLLSDMRAAADKAPGRYISVELCNAIRDGKEVPSLVAYYHRELTPEEVAAFDALGE